MRFFSKTLDKLKGALKKTAAVLNTDVRTLFIPGRQINDAFLAEMEEKLIRADMGVKNVMLKKEIVCASVTFRAGAVAQLTIWADRIGVEIVKHKMGADPAAVAYDACAAAKARNADVLIVDTAGRLHTQDHLMRELTKIRDVVAKRIEGAPHEVLLVLDATTGQNAILQAKHFGAAVNVTGIILAKLDGTAKGGVVLAIKNQLNIPVKFVGLGETPQDIETFDPA